MKVRSTQSGFSAFELVIVVAVVAILGLVGYTVYSNRQYDTTTTYQPAKTSTAGTVPSAPAISSTSDLDKASAVLDQTDIGNSNSSDSSQLDSQLATF